MKTHLREELCWCFELLQVPERMTPLVFNSIVGHWAFAESSRENTRDASVGFLRAPTCLGGGWCCGLKQDGRHWGPQSSLTLAKVILEPRGRRKLACALMGEVGTPGHPGW